MKQPDHLPTELRVKVNYLRNYPVEICNDIPGGYLVITVSPYARSGVGSGRIFTQSDIDEAIHYAETRHPETAAKLKRQLTLF